MYENDLDRSIGYIHVGPAKFKIFNAKFILLNTKFIIFNTGVNAQGTQLMFFSNLKSRHTFQCKMATFD